MSRFRKPSHPIWYGEYHRVWGPKYRHRVLAGKLKAAAALCLGEQRRQRECAVVALNVQADHVHLVVLIPPPVRLSDDLGRLQGKRALRWFGAFRDWRRRSSWGNPFWVAGDCVGTVGLAAEKIRKQVKDPERQEPRQEAFRFSR